MFPFDLAMEKFRAGLAVDVNILQVPATSKGSRRIVSRFRRSQYW
jgi:hypothetical protein